jgi:PKD repeat protein
MVFPTPGPGFTVNSTSQCLTGNSFTFTNTSTSGISYLWAFGDGNTSAATNPTHTYSASGTYIVKLVVTSGNGCKDSTTQTVTVHPQPIAAFTVAPPATCLTGNSFAFTNTSNGATSFSWTFGDGNTSTSINPTHSYITAGTYTIKLIVESGNGCKDSTTQSITVHPQPVAAFTVAPPASCLTGNSFAFTNTSTGATSYSWTFGDGNTSSLTSPTHTYTTAGTYTIKLVVTSGNGCKDSTTQTITVHPQPVASFTVAPPSNCLTGNSFAFTNTSTDATSYNWSFGDGNTSTSTSLTHTYTTAGTYSIKLVVTSSNGCKDSTTQTVTVHPQPVAAFTVAPPANCLTGNNFTFTNTSTGATSYSWTFGDGNTSTSTSPTHSYTTAGTYTIKLVVTSGNGCKDSTTQTVTVHPQPIASFTVAPPATCLTGNSFAFSNTSTGATSYSWTFGDGNTSTSINPTHTYTTAGTYTIKFVVASGNGCKDSTTQTVTVYPQPVAAFTLAPPASCLTGNSFAFTNTSTGATSYSWTFGDGNTSTITSPNHTYTTAGIYTVKMVVTSGNGCIDSTTQTVTVHPQPVAAFTLAPPASCLTGNSFAFTNTSTGATSYSWTFGDGNTSTITSPNHTYTTAGTYTIKLVVESGNGCKDSTTQTVTVHPQPVAAFTVAPPATCLTGNNFTITNTTTGATSYNWSFGDGNTSTSINPTHSFTTARTYTIKLVVTSGNGCKDSTTQTISVYPQPVASFTLAPPASCVTGNSFAFTNTSSGATSYSWAFGDGNASTSTSPAHTYTTAGTYTIKLVVTSGNGCKDSTTQTITVHPQPVAAFTVAPPASCLTSNNFSFTNTSTGATSYSWTFGDGNTSSLTSPTHTYTTAGTYTIKLVVTSGNGCKDSTTQTITVHPQPVASFTVAPPSNCLTGNSFAFTNTSTDATSYNWSFGDGNTSTSTSLTHTYTTAGTYSIKLVVTSSNGCKDSTTQTVTVHPQPVAAFTVAPPANCLTGNNFTFTNTSTGATSYSWTFGDGNTSTSTSPTHSYTTAGTYTIKLVVTSGNGCKDSTTQTVTVHPQPVAAFTVAPPATCVTGNGFAFTNTSTGATSYNWSFEDGNTSTSINPTHSYTTAGTYTIKLVVASGNGCKDSTTQTVTVYPQPLASFTVAPPASCVTGNSFAFSNTSTGGTSYTWTFGDGNTSSLTSPNHTYTTTGTYPIKLVVTSGNGCKDSTTQTITVHPQPVALIYSCSTFKLCNW